MPIITKLNITPSFSFSFKSDLGRSSKISLIIAKLLLFFFIPHIEGQIIRILFSDKEFNPDQSESFNASQLRLLLSGGSRGRILRIPLKKSSLDIISLGNS